MMEEMFAIKDFNGRVNINKKSDVKRVYEFFVSDYNRRNNPPTTHIVFKDETILKTYSSIGDVVTVLGLPKELLDE